MLTMWWVVQRNGERQSDVGPTARICALGAGRALATRVTPVGRARAGRRPRREADARADVRTSYNVRAGNR